MLLSLIVFFMLSSTNGYSQTNKSNFYDKDIPNPTSPARLVNDFADMLNPQEEQLLEQKLVALADSTSNQVSIVTVNTIGEYAIDDYAIRLGRKWGIGKEQNNGILILIAKKEKDIDIEIGYGLEGFVTDKDALNLIENEIKPAFKQGLIYKGLNDCTDGIIALIQGSYYNNAKSESPISPIFGFIIVILIILFLISSSKKGGGGSTLSGSGGGWINYGGGGWNAGSGGWSGGGSSGGFGGFGGGSFGGGGASGSWD